MIQKTEIHRPNSDFSFVSLKSEKSRGQPPTFSLSKQHHEAQTGPGHKRWTLRKGKLSPVDPLKDSFYLEQNEENFLQIQKKLKRCLLHRYLPLVQQRRSHTHTQALKEHQTLLWDAQEPHSGLRTVLTTGVAGVGKTALVHECMVDWCEDRALQQVHILCPLPLAQLNLLQEQSRSLRELLWSFCPGLRTSGLTRVSHLKVLFILDGLEQCRLRLDFCTARHRAADWDSVMPVEMLLGSLLEGKLAPDAQLWLLSRPGASRVPPTLVHRSTQLCPALKHMSALPLFWTITAQAWSSDGPRTGPAQPYARFLRCHMTQMQQKYGLRRRTVQRLVLGLCKTASELQDTGQSSFCEEQLRAACPEEHVPLKEALLYSGVCTQSPSDQICGEETLFCFIHPTVQNFMAQLHSRLKEQKLLSLRSINLCLNQMIQEELKNFNPATKTTRSLCRSQARGNGEGHVTRKKLD
ncbi:hypothetical protein WMY93_033023 [Mugilogobius chulae]|uniref:NACHT domain-containing protein n=1 Tax=Mugilogobius chulae TaxID=88201 RepID=A0AAW0MPU1_9GOBI